jgi:hypothetical protein
VFASPGNGGKGGKGGKGSGKGKSTTGETGPAPEVVRGVGFANGVYAVIGGNSQLIGLYQEWTDAQAAISGASGAVHTKFRCVFDATCAVLAWLCGPCDRPGEMEKFTDFFKSMKVPRENWPINFTDFDGIFSRNGQNVPYEEDAQSPN